MPVITPASVTSAVSPAPTADDFAVEAYKAREPLAASLLVRPIVHVEDVPGPLCLGLMESEGVITMLDTSAGYLTAAAQTLFGRASIARRLVPKDTIAAGTTAFWVWFSGTLPGELTVISSSHYRSLVFGRHIAALNRIIPAEDLRHVADLTLTSPLRTACDVACLPKEDFDRDVGSIILFSFLQYYEIPIGQCRKAILDNPRRPGFINGVRVFNETGTL